MDPEQLAKLQALKNMQGMNLSQYDIKTPDEQADTVPYNPDSGNLANIGNFALNNLSKDQGLGGAMPMAGSVARMAPMAEEAGEGLMARAKSLFPGSSGGTLVNNIADEAMSPAASINPNGANMQNLQTAMQANSRTLDQQALRATQLKAAKQNALNSIRNK